MKQSLERSITCLVEQVFTQSTNEPLRFLNLKEVSELLKISEPCLVVLKPHFLENPEIYDFLTHMIQNFDLNILKKERINITRDNVFDLYGDLLEVIRSGPDGEIFVENLVSSFVDGDESLVMIVYGRECYSRMVKTKRLLRERWSEGGAENVIHCSDNVADAIREITAFLHD